MQQINELEKLLLFTPMGNEERKILTDLCFKLKVKNLVI